MNFPFALPMLLDGAMGTNLYAAGMPQGVCVETWAAEHAEEVIALQRAFVRAGSDAVYTPSFSANAVKLAQYGLRGQVRALNLRLAAISREAVGAHVLIGGGLSPTGEFCEPFGDGRFLEHVSVYAEQALALKDAGVDFMVAETMMSLSEARAALIGAWQTRLPVFIAMTVDERGRTLFGTDALSALLTMQAMGAAAFGLNCSCGARAMAEQLRRIAPYAKIPLIAKPNAGMPEPGTGEYLQSPAGMAAEFEELLSAGAQIAGGCCGTTPAHIAAINDVVRAFDFAGAKPRPGPDSLVVCNETDVFFLDEDFDLTEPLSCSLDMADELMAAGDEGRDVISVHITSNEDAYCFSQNAHMARLPVSFLAENEEALEEALIYYNGRAMVDARSAVPEARQRELAAGYGAVVR